MARNDLIAFRVDPSERQLLKSLAAKVERTESDTVRFALRQLARQLDHAQVDPDPTTLPPAAPAQRAA